MPQTNLATPTFIEPILAEFEGKGDFDEFDISSRFEVALKENGGASPEAMKAAKAEYLASSFWPDSNDGWNTYFGPFLVVGGRKVPDLSNVDAEIIAYWAMRMAAAAHPVLKARYSDLVWDLSKAAAGIKPPIDACRTAIDSYVAASELADGSTLHNAEDRLARALKLALSVGDKTRQNAVCDAMFDLVGRFPGDAQWVSLFDTVFDDRKLSLSEERRKMLVAELERIVARVEGLESGAGSIETMPVAMRLANYYQSLGDENKAKQIVRSCGLAVERIAAKADGLLSVAWLSDLHDTYKTSGLRADAERVLVSMKMKGGDAEKQMVPITSSVKIEQEELDTALDSMTEGGLDVALSKAIGTFLPRVDAIRKQASDLRSQFPLQSMFTTVKMSEQQIVAKIGPADTDPDGALISDIAQHLAFSSFFLAQTLDRLCERYSLSSTNVMDFLRRSPAFDEDDLALLEVGIAAYLDGDLVKAIHVLVPRIEHALRRMLWLLGQPTSKPRREHTSWMVEKSINDLLEREPVLREFFGEDVISYLLAFLADPRGPNLRNRLSHGLMQFSEFRRQSADRVFHVLLLMGSIRPQESDSPT